MRVVITAGGTREPIDDVRVIANVSTGRLGARLAETFAVAGHEVLLLHGHAAVLPAARVERRAFGSSTELAALLAAHVPGADAVLHAAAVSDYVPERRPGKLPSDAPELVLRLARAPKLVDGLRALAPDAVLVGFKLTSGLPEEEALARARELLHRARLDLVVANDATRLGEEDHRALLVAGRGVLARVTGKAAIADALLASVEELATGRISS